MSDTPVPDAFFEYGAQVKGRLTHDVQVRREVTVESDSGEVDLDLTLASQFRLVLSEATTINNPTGKVVGSEFVLVVVQDPATPRDITWGTDFEWTGGGAAAPVFSSDDVNAVTIVRGIVTSQTKIVMSAVPGDGATGNPPSTAPAANSITTAMLQNDSVTADKVADGAIDAAAKLGANVVTTAKILDDNVTAAKIADGAIDDGAKVADGVLTAKKLQTGGYVTGSLGVATYVKIVVPNANGSVDFALPAGVSGEVLDAWFIKTGADGGAGGSVTLKNSSGATIGVFAVTEVAIDKSKTPIDGLDDQFNSLDPGGNVTLTAAQGAGPTNVAGYAIVLIGKG